jgi:hypothetical protein
MPGKAPSIKGRMQSKADGEVTLTWIIGEPKWGRASLDAIARLVDILRPRLDHF